MKSFYLIIVLIWVVFLHLLSNQFVTSQIELPNRMEAKDLSDFVKPSVQHDSPNLTASAEENQLNSKWFSLKQFVLKQSNWVKLKDLKVNSIY